VGIGTSGKGYDIKKYYVLMYENGKMRPFQTIPGIGEGQ
jgi:hypothetical protein